MLSISPHGDVVIYSPKEYSMKLLFSSIFGLIGFVLLLFGCPLLATAAGLYYFVDASTSDWVLVPGTVTAMRQSESYNSDMATYQTLYCPTIEYVTLEGQSLSSDLNECSTPPMYSVGDSVEVTYDPLDPQHVQLMGGVQQVVGNVFVVVLAVIGGLLSFIGVVMVIAAIFIALRKSRASTPSQPVVGFS
jgi:hypothetical protein